MRLLACLLVFVLAVSALVFAHPIVAHDNYSFPDANPAKITESLEKNPIRFLPNKPYYFLVTIKENVTRLSKPSSTKRAEFDMILAGKRLREAYELLEQNDAKWSSKALIRYSFRLKKTIEQLEKARSQNQEVLTLSSKMADSLGTQEIILSATFQKWQTREDSAGFDLSFSDAVNSFGRAVSAINNIQPGLKNRYKITNQEEADSSPIPIATPSITTPSANPRRIIY